MCNNYLVGVNDYELASLFDATLSPNLPFQSGTGSILPTNTAPAVRMMYGRRELVGLRWWLVPEKGPGLQSDYPMFNARVETVATKQSYKEPFKTRRCLLPLTAWVEGNKKTGKHRMRREDGKPFAVAGLWDRWQRGETVIESCTMLMMDSAPELASVHDRMPIVLPPSKYDVWLDPELIGPKEAILSIVADSDLTGIVAESF